MSVIDSKLQQITASLPLVVIAGPTASGKTSLAIKLAKAYDGEIICADSRSIYKGMDIGTAKPSLKEQDGIVHWGLDLVNPDQYYSVANFKEYALSAIADIRSRGKIPFLVGGTGLYIDAVIFDYKFGAQADESLRENLNNMAIEDLHEYCNKNNIMLPENKHNKRYVIRSIEQKGNNNTRNSEPIPNTIVVGISTDNDELKRRVTTRIDQLINDGVIEESEKLGKMYGWSGESFKGNVYPLAKKYLDKEISLVEMKDSLISLDWKLVKRQRTWFKRNKYMVWGDLDESYNYISANLAKLS